MSAQALLARNEDGLYFPAYQRNYGWGRIEISRFFKDICLGIRKLPCREDAVTFLGAIILLWDRKHEVVHPQFQGHVPSRVFTVIDGQQRLTTLLLANLLLHSQIASRTQNMVPGEPVKRWILERKQQILTRLQSTFEIDFQIGDDEYRYYPKMIRALEDCWSWQAAKARYTSPMASFLRSYIFHHHQQRRVDSLFKVDECQAAEIRTAWGEIERHVSAIVSEEADNPDDDWAPVLPMSMLCENLDVIQAFIGSELPEEARALFAEREMTRLDKGVIELYRLFTLAQYLLERMALTIIVAHTEEQALDVCESLRAAST